MHETFFSTKEFADAWSASSDSGERTLAVNVLGSGPNRTIHCVERRGWWGLRTISMSPMGLFGSPGWDGDLEESTLSGILRRLLDIRTLSLKWNVRFDHGPLASGLSKFDAEPMRVPTHVLSLSGGYGRVHARFHEMIRRHVRKAGQAGVTTRSSVDPEDVGAYYAIHLRLAEANKYNSVYSLQRLLSLAKLTQSARFIVAELNGRLLAGGLFFRDGNSVLYWHGASDRAYSNLHPSSAVLDEAIRWSCELGCEFFNMGASGGLASLEAFKDSWGAHREHNWSFQWVRNRRLVLSRLREGFLRKLTGEASRTRHAERIV